MLHAVHELRSEKPYPPDFLTWSSVGKIVFRPTLGLLAGLFGYDYRGKHRVCSEYAIAFMRKLNLIAADYATDGIRDNRLSPLQFCSQAAHGIDSMLVKDCWYQKEISLNRLPFHS